MAIRKSKPAAAPAEKPAARATAAAAPPPAPATSGATGTQRLLREAAWSRMFGRTEAKNPFARPR